MMPKELIRRFIMVYVLGLMVVGCASSGGGPEGEAPAAPGGEAVTTTGSGSSPTNEEYTPEKGGPPAVSTPQATDVLNKALQRGDFEGLEKAAAQILTQNSNDPKAWAALGVVKAQQNKQLAAMYFFNKSLSLNPNQPEVYTHIGVVQMNLKEQKEAIKAFKKALELGASDGVAAANLGSIYAFEGDYFKAMPVLDRAIKAGVKDTRIYNNFGIALTANGRYQEAKEIYREALKLSSANREAAFNLAILYIDHLNDNQAGLDMLNKVRFLGLGEGMRDRINSLENKAKAGLK